MRNFLISLKKATKTNIANAKKTLKLKPVAVFLLIALVWGSFLWTKSWPLEPASLKALFPLSTYGNIDLSSSENHLEGLPIAEVNNYEAENAWSTAILIPQYHRYPGSNPDDSVNDSAQRAQEEIYQIIPHVNKKYNAELVMVEGELFGEVSSNKISKLAEKTRERNKLSDKCKKLEEILEKSGVDPTEEKLIKEMDKAIAKIDREIILDGAPFKLKAEGKKLVLFGSENKVTQEQSRTLVKNYIYLQDREKELNGRSGRLSSRSNRSNKLFNDDMKLLLSKLLNSRNNSLLGELRRFESEAEMNNEQESLQLAKEIEKIFSNIGNIDNNTGTASISLNSSVRADNPYENIRDPKKIDDMLEEAERQINEVIIDKRNIETAENFSSMLKEEKQTTGILQFGAGHESGLIKELNSRGISVVVITPREVKERNSQ